MHGCLPPMPRLTIKGWICSLDPCSRTKRDHWRFSTMSCACCLRNGWPQESCYVCGQMHIYWCRFLGFTSLWFKALTVALDLEPCLGNSTCNEPADETQALLCDGLWALQHDFCMWCTARQKVIRLLSRSFVLLCCMLKFRMYACCCNTHAHMCTHTHASGSHVCMDRGPWYRWMELMVWFRHHSIYVHLCTVPEFQATEYYVQLWSYGVCL